MVDSYKGLPEELVRKPEQPEQPEQLEFPRGLTDYQRVQILKEVKLKDGGTRIQYDSGCVRENDTGRGAYELIGLEGLKRISRIYELGAKKYSERNWEKGGLWSRNLRSALRHMVQWMEGDSGEDHLAMACWNLFAIMEYEKTYKAGNDIPNRQIWQDVKKTGEERRG